ncbi:MAG: retropepsin-like domain-containing protein [Candidatus Eremiobacteraeota bacterium]|nr:retropepsin-like domain-containing protein [Candidatus Eremiobacteraeota bacterium]
MLAARTTAFFVAGAIATFAGARAQAPSQDAQSAALLAKHRAYVGWQFGDGTFRTMRVSASVTDEKGVKIERIVRLYAGLLYHATYTPLKRDEATEHSGFTGNVFWHSSINGFTTPVYGNEAKYLASFTVLQQEGTTELPATFMGNKTVDGKSVGVVRVTLANGDAIECDVDPQTGAYVAAKIDPGGSYESTLHILSYRDIVPGKKFIGSFRFDEEETVHSNDAVEPNVAVTADDFHPPAATAFWSFGNGDPSAIKLTANRILLDATVNGVKGRFILDTGADGIVLDDRFADRAKTQALRGSGEAETLYGSVPTRVRRVDTIAVGSATLHNALVYSEDFRSRDYRGLDWAGYDGLIGYDLFAAAIVKLDVYGSKLAVLEPSSDVSSTNGIPLLVDLSDGVPAIPMTYDKTLAVNAILDTGNPGVAFIVRDALTRYHLSTSLCGSVQGLTIGPITYLEPAACTRGMPFSTKDVLLGYDFLKHFDYVFDYPHGRMFMTPNKN